MSRIGSQPIPVPEGIKVQIKDGALSAEGPKGKMQQAIFDGYPVEMKDGEIVVSRPGEGGSQRSMHGLLRSLLANAVEGVTNGFEKKLEIHGVGYRAEVKGKEIHLALGYSHPVVFPIPDGISVEIDKQNRITVTGADKQKVGQVAAELRALRRPDPYKGKGIRYADERLRRKVGKAGAR